MLNYMDDVVEPLLPTSVKRSLDSLLKNLVNESERMQYKTIDLCAGIGGIRRGFEMTGRFENVLSAEIDKYARMTYRHLFQNCADHGDADHDLTDPEFKELVKNTPYDILLAGFPCQTFSRAGKREGFENQDKGIIFFHIAEIISATAPKAFFLENVDNLLTHDKGRTIKVILKKLASELNYKIIGLEFDDKGKMVYSPRSFVRNSKDFGVPQNRPRTYIMGFNRSYWGDSVDNLPNELPVVGSESLYRDLNEVLDKQAEPRYYMAQGYLETLEKHKARNQEHGNGFGYRIVNDASIECPIANTLLATGGSGRERNLVYDPQPEIYGLTIPGKQTPINDKGIRVMTPIEWGKLQGFINYAFMDAEGVDHFDFPDGIPDVQRYKQFGNSVTIPVIKEMAQFMINCLDQLDK